MQKPTEPAAKAGAKPQEDLDVLVIEGADAAAEQVVAVLREHLPALRSRRVDTLAAAEAALAADVPQLVLTSHELADGTSLDLLDHVRDRALAVPVVVLSSVSSEELAVRLLKAGASDYLCSKDGEAFLRQLPLALLDALRRHRLEEKLRASARQREQLTLLNTIRSTLARVNHEVNNPLAIISGNAQLLLELARVMEMNEDLVQPIRDIEEASRRIAGSLRKLASLKETIPQVYTEAGANGLDLDALQHE